MKLFLVVRRDLSPGARAAQLCHALREFADKYPEDDKTWYETSNTLVLLETDETHLLDLAESAKYKGVPVAVFKEPDLGDITTAIALGWAGKSLVRGLSLAFRP